MDRWDYEEFLNTEIQKINDLKSKGFMVRDLLDLNEFSYEALKRCGLPPTYLIPKSEPQIMTSEEWNTHTSSEHKWEFYDDVPFGDCDERDRVMLGLIYSSGLKHLLEILPSKTKEELAKLLCGR
ncbi:MAG: hypothetical protein P4L59_16995 [Desulfosporosinus sp.]|nr:hypothetical protein [Desulfosporosinus sp.]